MPRSSGSRPTSRRGSRATRSGIAERAASATSGSPRLPAPSAHRHKTRRRSTSSSRGSGRVKIEDEVRDVRQWDAVRFAPARRPRVRGPARRARARRLRRRRGRRHRDARRLLASPRRPSAPRAARRRRPALGRVLARTVAHDRLLRGAHLVEPAHRASCGASCSELGLLGRLARDREHRVAERVERLLRLGLGRLDHQRLGHDQREVDRRRVEAVVHQPLRDVERADAVLALQRRAR